MLARAVLSQVSFASYDLPLLNSAEVFLLYLTSPLSFLESTEYLPSLPLAFVRHQIFHPFLFAHLSSEKLHLLLFIFSIAAKYGPPILPSHFQLSLRPSILN